MQETQYIRSIIETSFDPLFTISDIGKIMDVNEAAVLATETFKKKMIGANFISFFVKVTGFTQRRKVAKTRRR